MKVTEQTVVAIDPALVDFLDDLLNSMIESGFSVPPADVGWRDVPLDGEMMVILHAVKRYGDKRVSVVSLAD